MIRAGKVVYMMCALAASAALSIGCSGDPGDRGAPGAEGPQGAPGDKGDQGDPGNDGIESVSAVSPRVSYLDRQVEVSISGNATNWTDAAKVDFGAGINVDDTIVASPTSIVAKITINDAAELGLRDVMVTDKDAMGADATLTYKGAFEVQAPLSFDGYLGTLAQGSIFIGRLSQKDVSTPFDNAGAPDYPYLSLDAGPDASFQIQEATSYGIDFLALVDVNAPATDTDVLATSGLQGGETRSLAPKAVPLMARAPVALKDADPNPQTAGAALDSSLFSFATDARKLVTITASSANPDASPAFALLPPSGKFSELISYGSIGHYVTATADPIYVVYWDNSGAELYGYDLKVETKDSNDIEPNDACDMAQAVGAVPAALVNLSLANEKDEDWFLITATAADVGKAIHVTTKAGDANTDTYVEVFTGTCMNLMPLGDPSVDLDYHENHTSKPIPAVGDYWVRVRQSPDFPYAGSLYDLDIELVKVEIEPNDTCATSQATTLPEAIDGAALASATDEDWYAVDITAADVGKQIHVVTSPGDADTDTYVELFGGACAAPTSLGTSSDAAYHEDFLSDPIAAVGIYYVKVSNSPTFPYAGAGYKLAIDLVTPPPPVDIEPTNNTCAGATPGTLPANISPLQLPSDLDEDWFMFTAAAADVGKTVHVVTTSPDLCDTLVEVFEGATCAGQVSLGGPSDDASYSEDWVSTAITAAGPVWVKVSYSTFGFSGSDYTLAVTLE